MAAAGQQVRDLKVPESWLERSHCLPVSDHQKILGANPSLLFSLWCLCLGLESSIVLVPFISASDCVGSCSLILMHAGYGTAPGLNGGCEGSPESILLA